MKKTVLSAVLLLGVPGFAHAARLYVVNERAESLSVVDLSLGSVVSTIPLADPNGDGRPDPPSDIAFSSDPAHNADHAFVTQGRYLRVVNLGSGAVVRTHDIAALLGTGDLVLAGCDAAPPRQHVHPTTGMPVVKSYLHLAATLSTGEARFAVFDQQALFLTAPGPPAGQGSLGTGAKALGVRSLEEPFGANFQRAFYQTSRPAGSANVIEASLVASARPLGSAWTVIDRVSRPTVLPLPETLRLGAPYGGGELPVLPSASSGTLSNLDTGDACPLGGDLRAVSVTGPGLTSYTILAVRQDTDELLVIDGRDCSTATFPTGASPRDVATLGRVDWGEAFTANRDSDSITRLKRDGSVQSIPVGPGGPGCVSCPIALEVAPPTACAPTNLRLDVRDADNDTVVDDLHLEWLSPGCPSATQFVVHCTCVDEVPDCPCACDCDLPVPQPGCQCPGLLVSPLSFFGAIQLEPDTPIQENPWKILGVTAGNAFDATDLGDDAAGVYLNVSDGTPP